MINEGVTKWGVKTGFLYVDPSQHAGRIGTDAVSFAATGAISVVVAWFILPEVTRRTPAEIDEL